MNFIFEQIRTGGDRNFGYLIGDRESGAAALIDPSYSPKQLVERASLQGLKPDWIISTHGHSDHTNGNSKAQKLTSARVAVFESSSVPHDVALQDNQLIPLGSLSLRVLHLPGHSPDHIVLCLEAQRVAITGDLLFVGKIGGTAGDEDARQEYKSLERLLGELPDETTIWPGHDYGCRPSSTVALEKATNPFLLTESIDEFLRLKRDWASFKAEQGLV